MGNQGKGACVAAPVASGTTDIPISPAPPTSPAGVEQQVAVVYLHGWSLKGAAATVVYIRSGSITGPIIGIAGITAANGVSNFDLNAPVSAPGGIFLDRDGSNAVEGCVYYS